MEVLLVLVVIALAIALIAGPLRSGHAPVEAPPDPERTSLENAKEAKYREIRDAELDYRTGKLSQEDWQGVDSGLRREAVELLRRLDALEEGERKP